MDINITDSHVDEVISALNAAKPKILEIIGLKAEKYAKALCPVGTVESTGKKGYRGGTLRNSITHQIDDDTLSVGSNVEYAPYVELGTGPNFTPPPEWESFDTPKGNGVGHGYVRPRKYLQPAIADHINEYVSIMETELKNA
jgi:phage gpG-like protein